MKILNPDVVTTKPLAMIFDTDNTIYNYMPAHKAAFSSVVNKAARILHCSPDEFTSAYYMGRTEIKSRLGPTSSSHSRLLYFQVAIERTLGRSNLFATLDMEQTYWRSFLNNAILFDGVKPFVSLVRELGIKTAVVTDLTAQIQFRKLVYFELDEYFDYIVTSEESGADKPNASSFNLALSKLKVSPHSCWMIGDSFYADMVGAKNLGFTTLQKYHNGIDASDLSMQDIIFNSYHDLYKLLDSYL